MSIINKMVAGAAIAGLLWGCKDSGGGDTKIEKTSWSGDAPAASASLADKYRYLASLNGDSAQDFELGIVEAMRAIEVIYQHRYRHFSGELPLTPGGGRMALPVNPDAEFDPAFVENAMTEALVHLSRSRAALKRASGKEFSVVLHPKNFWFDIDEDGLPGDGESLMQYLPGILGNPRAMRRPGQALADVGEVRFDTADADWALAYAHTLSGMAEMVLAMDPTPAIKQVVEGREAVLGDESSAQNVLGFDSEIDAFAAALLVLRGKPDAERTRRAHGHFLEMVEANKRFWSGIEKETDDDREWIPNPNQTSSMGVTVSQETADGWQTVLSDAEDVLQGRKLVPYWRIDRTRPDRNGNVRGLNIKKMFMNPPETDFVYLVQGGVLAPYLEKGQMADMQSWREFGRMTGNQTSLFALWFN